MYYRITAGQSATANKSIHDNFTVQFSTAKSAYDNNPLNKLETIAQLKQRLLDAASISAPNKDKVLSLIPSTFWDKTYRAQILLNLDDATLQDFYADHEDFDPLKDDCKAEIFAKQRHLICLDFDQNPNIDLIKKRLSPLVYFLYTTHSHTSSFGKYRVIIPMMQGYSKTEWVSWVKPTLISAFKQIIPAQDLDLSCFTFGQIGYFPVINSTSFKQVELFFNDGDDTRILEVEKLPVVKYTPPAVTYTPEVIDPLTADNVDKVIDFLIAHPHMQQLDYVSNNAHGAPTRMVLATSLFSIGATDAQVMRADNALKRKSIGEVKGSTTKLNLKATKTRRNGHAGILRKYVPYESQLELGLSKPYKVGKNEWNIEKSVDYLSLADYTDAKRVLICADMGTGKNHLWSNTNVAHRVLAPLRSIVGQQGSTNNVYKDKTTTYDQAKRLIELIESKEINPMDEILVVDEAHNLLLADYRLAALSNVESLLAYDWKQIIFQSATIASDSFDMLLDFDIKVRIDKIGKATLTYYRFYKNADEGFEDITKTILSTGYKSLILFNNQEKLLQYQEVLKQLEISSFIVSAETTRDQSTEAYKLANSDNYTMGDVQVILGTNSLVEGISIQDDITNANVFIIGNEPPEYIKQLCGRFRKAKKVDCYHIARNYKSEKSVESWIAEHKEDSRIACNNAKMLSSNYKEFGEAEHADFIQAFKIDANKFGLVFNVETKTYMRSALSDLFAKADANEMQFYSNFQYADAVIHGLGFKIIKTTKSDSVEGFKELQQECKKRVRKDSTEARIAAVNHFMDMVESVREGDELPIIALNLEFSARKVTDKFQLDILSVLKEYQGLTINIKKMKKFIDKMINKKTGKERIIIENAVEFSQMGIMSELANKYTSGVKLLQEEQNAVIGDIVTVLMEITENSSSLSRQEAFDHVMKMHNFKNVRSNIQLTSAGVEVNIERPASLLRDYLPEFEVKRSMTNGIRQYAVVMK